ncbi:hypothetical protein [Paraburkholderia sp.]|uniref:hypothetical protein n=1 Tax=Paraburkholderia sp. TaxID=1926495 RepID=UPI0039E40EA3
MGVLSGGLCAGGARAALCRVAQAYLAAALAGHATRARQIVRKPHGKPRQKISRRLSIHRDAVRRRYREAAKCKAGTRPLAFRLFFRTISHEERADD